MQQVHQFREKCTNCILTDWRIFTASSVLQGFFPFTYSQRVYKASKLIKIWFLGEIMRPEHFAYFRTQATSFIAVTVHPFQSYLNITHYSILNNLLISFPFFIKFLYKSLLSFHRGTKYLSISTSSNYIEVLPRSLFS